MKSQDDDYKWVKLMSFQIIGFAEMAKDILEKENIPCLIQKDAISTAYVTGGGALGSQYNLYVPEDDMIHAHNLLENLYTSNG